MPVLVPLSGKFGRIRLNTNEILLENWAETMEEEQELFAHFGMDADATGNIFKGVISGFTTGDVTVVGKYDNTAGASIIANKGVWPGALITSGFLGWSQTVGLQITGQVKSVKGGQSVDPKFGTFEAVITLKSCVFTAAGP